MDTVSYPLIRSRGECLYSQGVLLARHSQSCVASERAHAKGAKGGRLPQALQ